MVCAPEDVEAMTDNIRRLISNAELRDRLRERGIFTAKQYSWERAADRLLEFFGALSAPSVDIGHWVPHPVRQPA